MSRPGGSEGLAPVGELGPATAAGCVCCVDGTFASERESARRLIQDEDLKLLLQSRLLFESCKAYYGSREAFGQGGQTAQDGEA